MNQPTSRVLPHGPLERLDEHVYRVEGSLPNNMPLKRVMTLVQLASGGLLVHNAISLEPDAMRELEALGAPQILVVPNRFHRLDAPAFKARYPELRVVCPSGGRRQVEQVMPVDLTCEEVSDERVRFENIAGTREAEAVMIVRSAGGVTLVFTDLIFNMPHIEGLRGFVLRHITTSSGGPRVSRVARMLLIKDRAALRSHLERLSAIEGLARIVVAHHQVIDADPAATLRAVAASL